MLCSSGAKGYWRCKLTAGITLQFNDVACCVALQPTAQLDARSVAVHLNHVENLSKRDFICIHIASDEEPAFADRSVSSGHGTAL